MNLSHNDELIEYWGKFNIATLARINLSFLPMYDLLKKNNITFSNAASFGSGSCTHEISLSLLYPEANVYCYDESDHYIPEYSRPYFDMSSQLNFKKFDFSNTLEESFDFVFSIQTLEHIEDYTKALDMLCNVVSKGGALYIDTPLYNEGYAEEDIEALKTRAWEIQKHYHLGFSRSLMIKRLEKKGFEIIESGYYCYPGYDQKVMDLVRNLYKGIKTPVDRRVICDMNDVMITSLEYAEKKYKSRWSEIDQLPMRKRVCMAYRILARKR